ncbi:hypothetical protein ACHQM5_015674 [Ranunculus cassubicifolius]
MALTRSNSSSSSGEEDGDAEWKAAINSVANGFTNTNSSLSNGVAVQSNDDDGERKPQALKLYEIKAQKILGDLLDKSFDFVKDPIPMSDIESSIVKEDGIRLFRRAPPGIAERVDEYAKPRKKPRILPGEVADEKSKKFRRRVESVVVDGTDILVAAKHAVQKSVARYEAKNVAAEAAKKREEERVAELKKVRGEKWLPAIAKEMMKEAAKEREEKRVAELKKIRGEKCLPAIAKKMRGCR